LVARVLGWVPYSGCNRLALSASAALAVTAAAATAQAQAGAAVLVGKVVDASTHKGVPDVVVTATSPALQGEQIVTTDSSGTYRVPSLPYRAL